MLNKSPQHSPADLDLIYPLSVLHDLTMNLLRITYCDVAKSSQLNYFSSTLVESSHSQIKYVADKAELNICGLSLNRSE